LGLEYPYVHHELFHQHLMMSHHQSGYEVVDQEHGVCLLYQHPLVLDLFQLVFEVAIDLLG
jgi:hypothetical protein